MHADEHVTFAEYPVPTTQSSGSTELGIPIEAPRGKWSMVLLATGLILIGLNLRIGVAAIGPVLGDIQASLGLSAATASLLTTIPVFAFGVFAFFTPMLMRRLGMHRLLGVTMLVLATGILLRFHASLTSLFLGTLLVGAAIAIGNVAMPAAIKKDFPHRAGLMMGLYSTALFAGAAAASGLTVPLLPHVGDDWRAGLVVWAIPAILAAVIWIPQLRRSARRHKVSNHGAKAPSNSGQPTMLSLLTDPIALGVTTFMGLQSLSYYVALTWVPTMFQDAGMSAATAGWMLAYSAFPGVLTSLFMPTIAQKMTTTWLPVVFATALIAVAFLGIGMSPMASPYLWMTLLGLGQGACISLSLSYIVWRSPDTEHTGQLSTMAQGYGYLVAGLGPLGMGALYSATGSWTAPLVTLGILLVVQLGAGIVASRPVYILGHHATAETTAAR
ncbi:MAG: MFS transporter [Yaniella sp.]|uniref:CynX/NimT family MFS transporter n=1 Tax=Yaniella sp. TaxID=2773929 RepID=UPI002649DC5F|nr:MFS transporter [Yaniella sp.]MDN5703829.1 MFS transporter [Yaniella sp.]MDN5731569.1 MFS transporter [Yaniella sp.]MDN5741939.1 MFS transporter [Yaniella sp.]MDN5816236.1 MFS transporter [Yaniella sp.]MDN5817390.1 MFS transporter [Yaniella sp.]